MRQIYSYSAGLDTSALTTALAGNHVGGVNRIDVGASQLVAVDFLPDETSTETSAAQTVCTGAPYNLTLSSSDDTIRAETWMPWDFGASLAVWLNPAHMPHMWQEGNTVQQITPVTATGQLVGSIQDIGPQAHHWTYSGNNLPTLNSDGGTECHLTFAAAAHSATGCALAANGSTSSLAFIHNTGVFSIHVGLRVANNGTQLDILDSNSQGGANFGIYVRRSSNNTIFVRITAGLGASTFLWSGSSTQTLQTTDGMCLLSISSDGTANGLNVQIAAKSADIITRSNAPLNVAPGATNYVASNDLQFGRGIASVSTALSADVRFLVILNRPSTAADRTLLTNWMNNQRMSSRTLFRVSSVGLLQPCLHYHDFTMPSLPGGGGMYTSSARSTSVASDGDSIYFCDHALDPTNAWGRALFASNAFLPIYRPNLAVPGGEWNGGTSPNNTNMTIPGPIWGGAWTLVIVAQNRDQVNGSHMVIASGAHFPLTGNNYVSNPSANTPYSTCHFSGATIGGTVIDPQLNPAAMMVELTRNGNACRLRTNKDNTREYVGTTDVNTNVTRWTPLNMGNQTIAGWEMDGVITLMAMYPFTLTRAQVDAYLMPQIQAKLPGVNVFS